jgi:ABC-type multidrug transport system ATPase subunit
MDGVFVEFLHVSASYKEPSGIGALFGKVAPPTPVLNNISFTLHAGTHVAVFGAGASGKTTLMKLVSGAMIPDSGSVTIHDEDPNMDSGDAAVYISPHSEEARHETVYELLHGYGSTHKVENLPARIAEIAHLLRIQELLHKNSSRLSASEKVRIHMAQAALSKARVLLFDDIADMLGAEEMKRILTVLFTGRTACITTRSAAVAESLDIPILLLHKTTLVHMGTRNEIAHATGAVRVIDAWIEGMRYDLLRKLRTHPGVLEVRLIPTNQFDGTCVRVTLRNSRYLPALYDALSQAPLAHIQELPVSLRDILDSLA